ncbi:MAG: helix-turn-helix domain-containing protein [Bacteroidota bacterium]
MSDFPKPNDGFLKQVISAIAQNLADESFGVAELADMVNMSRSNLLRRVKSSAGMSVSALIRQMRLQRAQAILQEEELTVSEVAFKVGFSSTSYFIRCYREAYGYTPGEEHKQQVNPQVAPTESPASTPSYTWPIITALITIGALVFFWFQKSADSVPTYDKTIAVLPFTNDSEDQQNTYLVNGLMSSVLDHLQKIEDLNVRSRTTVEQYRTSNKAIPTIAKELDVSYVVEGSGQRLGDQILLRISLVDAQRDRQIWSRQYQRQVGDIIDLQQEVATNIAQATQAVITTDERARIEQVPTLNPLAYDYYLRGLDQLNKESAEGLRAGIDLFKQAIEEDPNFAHPYAYIAVAYYYLDIFQAEKQYGEDINTFADKAILLDNKLEAGLIAKALYYMQDEQYRLAEEYFEKVLRYYPGSAWAHNCMALIYMIALPDSKKYLEHAIRGIRFTVATQDSSNRSITYLTLANALVQNGFLEEAEPYLKKSLDYNPFNPYSELLGVFTTLGQTGDFATAQQHLLELYQRDTMRFDVVQEVAKLYCHQEDYSLSWYYYEKFDRLRTTGNLNVYADQDIKIAFVLLQLGNKEAAQPFLDRFKQFAESNTSIYHDLLWASYYSVIGDTEKGIAHLEEFSKQSGYQYWLIKMMKDDPLLKPLAADPAFKTIVKRLQEKFWKEHKALRATLEEEALI